VEFIELPDYAEFVFVQGSNTVSIKLPAARDGRPRFRVFNRRIVTMRAAGWHADVIRVYDPVSPEPKNGKP